MVCATKKTLTTSKTISKSGIQKVKDATNRISTLYRQAATSFKNSVSNSVGSLKSKANHAVNQAKCTLKNAKKSFTSNVQKVAGTISKNSGRIVQGTLGTLQAGAGAAQVYAGGLLCATGIGAVIGVPLVAHGTADVSQGIGNTYYAIKGPDQNGNLKQATNFIQEGYKRAGRTIGNLLGGKAGAQRGEKIASGAFFVADTVLSFVSGKAILQGAKAAKQGTTFFKGTQEVLKLTGKNALANTKASFKAIKELPVQAKNAGASVVKQVAGALTKDSKQIVSSPQKTKQLIELDLQFFAKKSDEGNINLGRTFKSQYDIPINDKGYTKSSIELGKKVHKEYKAGDVNGITKFKEYVLPSGKRVDYIDFESKTVYELKPHNPNQIRNGTKQLQNYLEETESVFGEGWTSVLDTY